MTRAPLAHLVAAATLVVAATCVLGSIPGPAAAAACGSGSGVTVVVDPGALGGALTTACDDGVSQPASDRFADVGATLTYAQRQPGFVCRVNEAPASEPCINAAPADAYWALFWSDGKSGAWTYSSIGVTGLTVPEGGAVALAWQQGSARRTPSTTPPVHASITPTPTPTPTQRPTKKPTTTRAPEPPGDGSSTTAPTAAPPAGSSSPSPARTSQPATTDPSVKASQPAPPDVSGSTAAAAPDESTSTPPTPSATAPGDSTSAPPTPSATAPEPAPSEAEPTAAQPESRRVPTWLSLTILVGLLVAIGISAMAARRRTHH